MNGDYPITQPLATTGQEMRNCTASSKMTETEFAALENLAKASGKKLGEWVRDLLLRQLNAAEPLTLIFSEVLGVRMILLNVLEPMARGEQVSAEEFKKMLSAIDDRKVKRARDRMAQPKSGEGV